jgi:hypothetical protein
VCTAKVPGDEAYDEWLRSWAQTVDGMSLGGPAELWRETPKHPANEWLHNKAQELGRRLNDAYRELDRRCRSESNLTNFGLHSQALPGGGTPTATVTQTGQVRLLIPDLPAERLYLFEQFTYDEERDLSQFAHEVLDSVSRDIDDSSARSSRARRTRWRLAGSGIAAAASCYGWTGRARDRRPSEL